MAKFKPYNPDQEIMLPISLQNQIVPGSLEHTINELVENHIDLSLFDRRYKNDATGAHAINPNIVPMPFGRSCSRSFCSPIPEA